MKSVVVLGVVAAVVMGGAGNARADWTIVNEKDPMTDEITIGAYLNGRSGDVFSWACFERSKQIIMMSSISPKSWKAIECFTDIRLRFDRERYESFKFRCDKDGLLATGNDAFYLFKKVISSSEFAYEFTNGDGSRFVDVFYPTGSNKNQLDINDAFIACLKKAK